MTLMQDNICVLDNQDKYTIEKVKKSNRLFELKESLGEELVGIIEQLHRGEDENRAFWSQIGGLGGSALLAFTGFTVSYFHNRKIGRRDFLDSLCKGFICGLGGLGLGPISSIVAEKNYDIKVKDRILGIMRQYPSKSEDISEYVKLRYQKFPIML